MLRYPAVERNKEAILRVFKTVLTNEGKDNMCLKALEIGSGSGEHVTHLARHCPHIEWQPTEVDNRLLESIRCHIKHMDVTNVLPPIPLDCSQPINRWPIDPSFRVDLIVCVNVIHITPWNCTLGLFEGSGALLDRNGLLITYGPYASDGVLTPESNVNFDHSLRSQNPEWGVRDIRDLKLLATRSGLCLVSIHEMPANNKILVFRKS